MPVAQCQMNDYHANEFLISMGSTMNAVTVSPQFQIFIPQDVRDQVHLEAGQQMQVIAYNDRIELIPIQSPVHMRGFLKGINTSVPRELDRS